MTGSKAASIQSSSTVQQEIQVKESDLSIASHDKHSTIDEKHSMSIAEEHAPIQQSEKESKNDKDEEDGDDKKKKKKKKEPSVPIYKLFRFATPLEMIGILISMVLSVGVGAMQPVVIIIFGGTFINQWIAMMTGDLFEHSCRFPWKFSSCSLSGGCFIHRCHV